MWMGHGAGGEGVQIWVPLSDIFQQWISSIHSFSRCFLGKGLGFCPRCPSIEGDRQEGHTAEGPLPGLRAEMVSGIHSWAGRLPGGGGAGTRPWNPLMPHRQRHATSSLSPTGHLSPKTHHCWRFLSPSPGSQICLPPADHCHVGLAAKPDLGFCLRAELTQSRDWSSARVWAEDLPAGWVSRSVGGRSLALRSPGEGPDEGHLTSASPMPRRRLVTEERHLRATATRLGALPLTACVGPLQRRRLPWETSGSRCPSSRPCSGSSLQLSTPPSPTLHLVE